MSENGLIRCKNNRNWTEKCEKVRNWTKNVKISETDPEKSQNDRFFKRIIDN